MLALALHGTSFCVGSQTPIVLDDYSEPEPDVWVASVPRRQLQIGKPRPHELALVIEVGDATIRADRRLKLPVYAAAGVPETWMIDLTTDSIERHTDPLPVERFARGGAIPTSWGTPLSVDDVLQF